MERLLPECLHPRLTSKRVGVHYWICFTAGAKGPLFIWDRNTMGNYTALGYQQRIIPLLYQFIQEQERLYGPHIVVQDNAPAHRAQSTLTRFAELRIALASH